MEIKCVRCGKKIENANKDNAKYIINPDDKRTYGINIKEIITKAPLTNDRILAILDEKTISQREYKVIESAKGLTSIKITEHPFTMEDFLRSTEIYPDTYGRREIVIGEKVSVPKTAIVCLDCLDEKDTVIW